MPSQPVWLYEGKHHGGAHTSSHHCVGHCLAFSDAQACFMRYSCKMISCDKLLQPAPDKDAVQTEALTLQRTSWAAAGYGDSTGAGRKSQVQHWSQAGLQQVTETVLGQEGRARYNTGHKHGMQSRAVVLTGCACGCRGGLAGECGGPGSQQETTRGTRDASRYMGVCGTCVALYVYYVCLCLCVCVKESAVWESASFVFVRVRESCVCVWESHLCVCKSCVWESHLCVCKSCMWERATCVCESCMCELCVCVQVVFQCHVCVRASCMCVREGGVCVCEREIMCCLSVCVHCVCWRLCCWERNFQTVGQCCQYMYKMETRCSVQRMDRDGM